jgi:hypothetical protein
LSREELRLTNLVTTDAVAEVLPPTDSAPVTSVADASLKPVQDRFVSEAVSVEKPLSAPKTTKTAEALVPTGGVATAPAQPQR